MTDLVERLNEEAAGFLAACNLNSAPADFRRGCAGVSRLLSEAATELTTLRQQLEAAQAGAERLAWMQSDCDNAYTFGREWCVIDNRGGSHYGDTIRDAIDAARTKELPHAG